MRALIAGWIGSTNLGDELVFEGLRRHLDALGIDPVAISISPSRTAEAHQVESIHHSSPRHTPALWQAARAADALVFGGGGLVQDQTSPWNLPFHISRVIAARTQRKPWAGVGLGIDHLRRRTSRRMAAWGLRNGVGVTVRDHGSAAAGRRLGLEPVVAADLALGLPPPSTKAADRLVVSLRAPVGRGLGTAAHKAGAASDSGWESAMAEALDRVASEHGLAVRFVAVQAGRDDQVHQRIAAQMRVSASSVAPGLDTVRDEFAECRLVVAMRYHAAIAALLAGRPAVLLDYSQKMSNLAAEVGPGFGVVGTTPDELDEMFEAASRALGHQSELEACLAALQGRELANRRMLERLCEVAR